MARNIAALFAGLIAAIIALVIVVLITGRAFPVAAEVNARDPDQIKAVFAALPLHVKLLIMLAWFIGPLAGTLTAKRLGTASWPLWTIAALFAIYVGLTVSVLPMPAWMQFGSVAAPVLAGLIAHHFGRSRPAPAETPAEIDADADQG